MVDGGKGSGFCGEWYMVLGSAFVGVVARRGEVNNSPPIILKKYFYSISKIKGLSHK